MEIGTDGDLGSVVDTEGIGKEVFYVKVSCEGYLEDVAEINSMDYPYFTPFASMFKHFVAGRAVTDAAHRKRVKYKGKCSDIGYGFLPFLFSSLGELEKDAVTLMKRIRKFSVTQDIRARVAVHIFNRISFVIAKRVRAQLVSQLPTNLL
ncbi:hypothetical protein Tco_0809317 [Tanacetum coccineum]